jgi:hypothetical protein
MEKTLVLGECKWTLSPVDRDILISLVEEKTAHIVPKQGYWRIFITLVFRAAAGRKKR